MPAPRGVEGARPGLHGRHGADAIFASENRRPCGLGVGAQAGHQSHARDHDRLCVITATNQGPAANPNFRITTSTPDGATFLDGIPAEGIGGLRIGVSPLEMSAAYATLAAGGWRHRPLAIKKVRFPDGKVDNWAEQAKAERGSGNSYLTPLIVLIIALGFFPGPVLDVINPSVMATMNEVGIADPVGGTR